MSDTTGEDAPDAAQEFINNLGDNQKSAMEAARKFVDTVNDAFPDIGQDGPRRKIIDAAFRMAEQFVDAGNKLALNVVDLTESALDKVEEKGPAVPK
jgi:tRNA splicing ligase